LASIRKYLRTISNQQLFTLIILIEVGWLLIAGVTIILDKSQFINFLVIVGVFNLLTLIAVLTILKQKRKDHVLIDQPDDPVAEPNRDAWEQTTIGYYMVSNLVLMIVFLIIVFIMDGKLHWVL